MNRFRWSAFLTLTLALLGGSTVAAGPKDGISTSGSAPAGVKDALPLLPAEAEMIFYLNIEQALRCELSKKYLTQPLKTVLADPGFKEFVKVTGLDPFKDVKLIVGGGARPREREALPSHGVYVFVGAFDKDKLTAAARMAAAKEKDSLAIVQEKGHTLLKATYTTQAGKVDWYLAVADQRRLLLGLKPDVLAALDRAARKAGPVLKNKALADALTGMDASTVFSTFGPGMMLANPNAFTGFDSPEGKWLHAMAADPTTAKLLKKIDTARLDFQVGSGVKLLLKMGMTDLDSAKEFKPLLVKTVNQLKLVINLAILQQPKAKALGELNQTLIVTSKGKALTVEASLSGKTIDDLVKASQQQK